MATSQDGLPVLGSYSEEQVATIRVLGTYLITITVCAIPVGSMLASGWSDDKLLFNITYGILAVLNLPETASFYVPVGLFLGFLITLTIDTYKRGQGLFLLSGVGLMVFGIFIPRGILAELITSASLLGVGIFLVSALVGLRIAGVDMDVLYSTSPYEFPRAPRVIYNFATVVLVVGFLEAHLQYTTPVIATASGFGSGSFSFEGIALGTTVFVRAGAGMLGLYGLRKFTEYERNLKVLQIGPSRSGKSAAFAGYRAAIENQIDASIRTEKTGTDDMYERLRTGSFPKPTNPNETRVLRLPFTSQPPGIVGRLFPKKMKISSVDYAGEKLEDILEDFVGTASGVNVSLADEDTGGITFQLDEDPDNLSGHIEKVASPGSDGETTLSDGGVQVTASDNEPDDDSDDGNTGEDGYLDWNEAMDTLQETEKVDEVVDAVRASVVAADRIVLTVPLDDFVGPIIAAEQDSTGDTEQNLEEDIVLDIGEAHRSDSDTHENTANIDDPTTDYNGTDLTPDYYHTAQLSPKTYQQLKRRESLTEEQRHEIQELQNELKDRGYEQEVRLKEVYHDRQPYFIINSPIREDHPWEYLSWYKDLVTEFADSKDFVLVVTMSDWAKKHFIREWQRQSNIVEAQGDNERELNDARPSPSVDDYDEFCEHIQEELLESWLPHADWLIDDPDEDVTGIDRIYALWYDIANDQPPATSDNPVENDWVIETEKNSTLLNGAIEVIRRLER